MPRKGFIARREAAADPKFDSVMVTRFINAIMVQRPVTMGRLAVESLVAQIKGEAGELADIDTGVTVVTADP